VTRWLNETEQRAWRAYLEVIRLLLPRLDRQLTRDSGLTMADYEILVRLSEADDRRMRMSEMSARTLMSRSRLSHQIGRMEAQDLVRRETCADDRRGSYAVLTEHGMAVLEAAAPGHAEAVRASFFDGLDPAQVEGLAGAFTAMVDHLAATSDQADDVACRTWGRNDGPDLCPGAVPGDTAGDKGLAAG
jgi:DNA-binding MarR family transcriptional regulator